MLRINLLFVFHGQFKLRGMILKHCTIHSHHRKTSEFCDIDYRKKKKDKCTIGRCCKHKKLEPTWDVSLPRGQVGVRKCDLQCPCTAHTGKAAFRMAVPAVSAWGLSSALVSAFQPSWEWSEGGLGVSSELIENCLQRSCQWEGEPKLSSFHKKEPTSPSQS